MSIDPAVAVHEGVRTPEADRARLAAPHRSVAARPQYDALAPVTVAAALTARAGRYVEPTDSNISSYTILQSPT